MCLNNNNNNNYNLIILIMTFKEHTELKRIIISFYVLTKKDASMLAILIKWNKIVINTSEKKET